MLRQLYYNSIRASSSWTREFEQSFSTTEARSLIRNIWTPYFTVSFALSTVVIIASSLYMCMKLHYTVYPIAFYLCLFLLLHLCIAYANQSIRHPLARSILTTITLFLLFTVVTLSALPEVQSLLQTLTLNQLLSTGLVILITVSLLRPKARFGWVDHVCLATIAATYAFLLSGIDAQVLQQWLSTLKQLLAISPNQAVVPINYLFVYLLCIVTLIEIIRYKYPFTGIDHLLTFIVALLAIPLQLSYGLQEIPHLPLPMPYTENIIKIPSDLISFNTLLTGIPAIAALLWIFIAPRSTYLNRLALLPLGLACVALQSFRGSVTFLPLLKPSLYPLAYSLESVLHLNQLTAYGLVLIIGMLLYRWQYPFQLFEQYSLFYVVIVCTLLQNAAWNANDPFTSASSLLQSPRGTTITESQLYVLAINKFLAQVLTLITIAILVIALTTLFLHLARDFAWVDRQIVRIKHRFNWLNKLILQLNHLTLLIICTTCALLLWLHGNGNLQHNSILSFTTIKKLMMVFLLIMCVVNLIRISRPLNAIDRWIILINGLACSLVLLIGKTQQTTMQDDWKLTSIKPWLADLHLTLPPQTIAFGLLLAALVSLMWIRRRIPQIYRNMLTIGFGLTLACALLQWFNPAFLLAGLILLALSILVAMQVEQV